MPTRLVSGVLLYALLDWRGSPSKLGWAQPRTERHATQLPPDPAVLPSCCVCCGSAQVVGMAVFLCREDTAFPYWVGWRCTWEKGAEDGQWKAKWGTTQRECAGAMTQWLGGDLQVPPGTSCSCVKEGFMLLNLGSWFSHLCFWHDSFWFQTWNTCKTSLGSMRLTEKI